MMMENELALLRAEMRMVRQTCGVKLSDKSCMWRTERFWEWNKIAENIQLYYNVSQKTRQYTLIH